MKNVILSYALIFVVGIVSTLQAQNARLQVLHNSAAQAAATVDVWLTTPAGSTKLLPDFQYKQATPYIDAPAGIPFVVSITAPGSMDTTNAVFHKSFTLMANETYSVVAAGDPGNNFDLFATTGMEMATTLGNTSVKVFHGSVGAPSVNIAEVSIPAGILVNGLAFGDAQGYLDLGSIDYTLQIQTESGIGVVEFDVPLSLFPDSALFVAATGYLDTMGMTPNNPFKLLAVTASGAVVELEPNAGLTAARLQVIHNSAASAAASVDVWLTDANGSVKLLPNFMYKDAAGYIDAPGATEFVVSITAAGSMDTTNAVLHKSFLLNSKESYVAVAAGDPGTNFDLFAMMGMEEAMTAGNTSIQVFHGSVGAPMVDIDEVSIPAGNLVNDLSFGEAQGYLDLSAMDYDIQVLTQTGIAAAEFQVPLSLFPDEALMVVATGYLDTMGMTPNHPFKLLAVTSTGNVVELNPKASVTPARIQIIHNCAISAADSVDIYLDDMKIADNFAFRNASAFLEVPGATEFTVDVDVKSSMDNSNPLYSENFVLKSNRSYIVVASGVIVLGNETYTPMQDFDLIPIMDAREASMDMGKVDVLVFHGATDAPMVDVNETTVPVIELVNDLSYGESQGYLELNPGAYELEIAVASNGNAVKKYDANISGLQGNAITIVASGFLDPAMNNNGADFGLWVATAAGGEMLQLPEVTLSSPEISETSAESFSIYPNPSTDLIQVEGYIGEVQVKVYSVSGKLMFEKLLTVNNHIDVSSLSVGSYILQIISDKTSDAVLINKI
ncbi:MAG: DUF4397 domain-containing protein [Bacteroidales bacterium]|nr:DUF4397 domain-containing protein [Bacteroidales bacterium]MCF8455795.1 DUF4397 domain-containing protein [Bacteroidales bacterium]